MPVQLTISEVVDGPLEQRARRIATDQIRIKRETTIMIAERFIQELWDIDRSPMVLSDLIHHSQLGDQRARWLVEKVQQGDCEVLACLRYHEIELV